MWPTRHMYDWVNHDNRCAARCRKFEIRVTQQCSRWRHRKLDVFKFLMHCKQAKTLFYTLKLLADVLLSSLVEHLECQDRVSPKPLAPFCSLLALKQVRMGPNQFLTCNRLKMGTVGARATVLRSSTCAWGSIWGYFRIFGPKTINFWMLSESRF